MSSGHNHRGVLPTAISASVVGEPVTVRGSLSQHVSTSPTLLGWNALKLTEQETAAIAKLRGKRQMAKTALGEIHQQTQGWVAGVVLIRLYLPAGYAIVR